MIPIPDINDPDTWCQWCRYLYQIWMIPIHDINDTDTSYQYSSDAHVPLHGWGPTRYTGGAPPVRSLIFYGFYASNADASPYPHMRSKFICSPSLPVSVALALLAIRIRLLEPKWLRRLEDTQSLALLKRKEATCFRRCRLFPSAIIETQTHT